jgi:peptidoglycan hydrolase-like protein with peptidoglycan-binding domain
VKLVSAAILVVMAAAVAGTAALLLRGRPAPAAASTAVPIGTARVVRTDIVSHQRVNGTLAYGAPTTISAPAGATADQVQQAASGVNTAQAALDAARTGDADTATAGRLAVAQAQAQVAAATPATLAQAQQALATAQQHADQTQHQANAQVATALAALQNAQAALQSASSQARLDGSVTWLPAPGASIGQGQQLYAVDAHPVVLMLGALPAWRALAPGCSGDDVRQLEQNLIALGFADASSLTVDGSFTGADAAAVRRWQAALGQAQTGLVRLGEVVFAPNAVRVSALRIGLGAPAQAGAAIVDVTATQHTVTAQVDTGHQQLVRQGDQVSVLMPDGRTSVPGTVLDVSRVAAAPPGQGQGQGQNGQNGQPTIAVTIALANESSAAGLDQAPVFVSIATATRKGVLAVPVTALLAQPDGSYAVAVRSGDARRLFTVQPGLFSDSGLVEVAGAGLAEGQLVEVPAR